ncbi:MAG: manganese efflux pump, partial [Erysipelotrichaceae bacterium]|nr:manganese efflux pump [Erysipelotrichaceae bacterium]
FACIVLIFLSLMFFSRTFFSKEFVERLNLNFNCMDSFKKAMFLGIDILLIGMCFYYLNIPIANQLIIAFCFSFVAVYLGLFLGYYLGAAFQKGIYTTCGILSLLVAFVQMSSIL